ncbi:phosphoenolpyruvate synthase [Patescibacteria group bacterium]|nr:phosphoenolpyruvate synthase [Patescibacteria group bacterium]
MKKYIKFFDEINYTDVPSVGGKNASLGEMYSKLHKNGIKVPNGFATTSESYRDFLDATNIKDQIQKILKGLDTHNVRDLAKRGAQIRQIILKAEFPLEMETQIKRAYQKLTGKHGVKHMDVAVRSSATAEDLPDASFAGQQETFLNIRGEEQLLIAVKKCIASLFTNRAISYRVDKKFSHFDVALSVGVQKMVRADKGSSGVMFTIDTESGFSNVVLINSIYGLGENIVQGKVNPDEFYVFKPTKKIISKKIGAKRLRMIYTNNKANPVKDIKISNAEAIKQSITDEQVIKLAEWGMIIEKHYGRAMDIEWALDGISGELFIIQARPETVHSVRNYNVFQEYKLEQNGNVIVQGQSVGNKIGAGKANKIMGAVDIFKFKKGQVLVTSMTDPDWEPIMKIASAIITDKGGRTCHAAIVSRELGIPCIVGTQNGSKIIKQGQAITANCAEGEDGFVYDKILKYKIQTTNLHNIKRPKTKIMMNLGNPDLAFASSFIPNDGVGLAREEFIQANHIRIHPLALINYNNLKDKKLKKQINDLTPSYKDKKEYFVDKLAEGVSIIAASFYPKDVIIRLSDFKTNEYANMIGGTLFEPIEENPMIGWRGASRYYDKNFVKAFELECKAIKKVREELGLVNLKIMLPFVRTIEEAKKVISLMENFGLIRGKNKLVLYCMIEIPANVILAREFAKLFDGFSIGSNDLTQLVLGVDRDSALVSHVYDENNQAVKQLITDVIKVARQTKTKIGICGQAPSDYPEFAKFLVKAGIDSISLIPDTIVKTTIDIEKYEKIIKR